MAWALVHQYLWAQLQRHGLSPNPFLDPRFSLKRQVAASCSTMFADHQSASPILMANQSHVAWFDKLDPRFQQYTRFLSHTPSHHPFPAGDCPWNQPITRKLRQHQDAAANFTMPPSSFTKPPGLGLRPGSVLTSAGMLGTWSFNGWLVVDPPLWKIWVRQLGLLFPIYGKIIQMLFQTTNQMVWWEHRKSHGLTWWDVASYKGGSPANCHFQVSESAMSWALKRSFRVNQTGFAKFGNNGDLKPRHIWDDLHYVFSCFFYTFPSSCCFFRIWRYLGNVKTTSGDWILRESAFFGGLLRC